MLVVKRDKDKNGRSHVHFMEVQNLATPTADDRLAALEAWRQDMEAWQQDIERRIAALGKRKNPA